MRQESLLIFNGNRTTILWSSRGQQ